MTEMNSMPACKRAAARPSTPRRMAAILGCALAGALASLPSQAQSEPPQDLLDAARQEGQVVWYETSVPDVGAKLKEAFEKRFAGIKLNHVSVTNAEQMTPRLLQEMRAKTNSADAVQISAEQITTLEKRGALASVDWTSLGLSKEQAEKPYAVATSVSTFVLMMNTGQVTENDRPKTWEDLLDQRWKGKIAAWGNPFPFVQLASVWGDDKVRDYLKRFAAQEPTLFPAPTSAAQAVASGDLPVGIGLYHLAVHSVNAGAPIALKTLDVAPVSINYSAVLKEAKHPNAGRLLIWWLSTPEGATAYEAATNRGNIYVPQTRAAELLKGVKVAAWPFDESATFLKLAPAYQGLMRAKN